MWVGGPAHFVIVEHPPPHSVALIRETPREAPMELQLGALNVWPGAAANNGCSIFLSTPHILNIKGKRTKLLAGECTPIKSLCFRGWTVLSNALEMHSGGEGCAIDAKVIESEQHTVFNTPLLKCLLYKSMWYRNAYTLTQSSTEHDPGGAPVVTYRTQGRELAPGPGEDTRSLRKF